MLNVTLSAKAFICNFSAVHAFFVYLLEINCTQRNLTYIGIFPSYSHMIFSPYVVTRKISKICKVFNTIDVYKCQK